jgi:hypothetical protein
VALHYGDPKLSAHLKPKLILSLAGPTSCCRHLNRRQSCCSSPDPSRSPGCQRDTCPRSSCQRRRTGCCWLGFHRRQPRNRRSGQAVVAANTASTVQGTIAGQVQAQGTAVQGQVAQIPAVARNQDIAQSPVAQGQAVQQAPAAKAATLPCLYETRICAKLVHILSSPWSNLGPEVRHVSDQVVMDALGRGSQSPGDSGATKTCPGPLFLVPSTNVHALRRSPPVCALRE